jgi:hypothetical protein
MIIKKRTTRKKVVNTTKLPEYELQSKANDIYKIIKPKLAGRIIGINNNSANIIKGAQNKRMGVLPGVSDMVMLLDDQKIVWIEFKTRIGSQSKYQIAFETMINSIGHHYHIVRSITEFITLIEKYEHQCIKPLNYPIEAIFKIKK